MTPVLTGLGLGFSLIIAIGAQNIFVLRQGLRAEHAGLVALICTLSDMVLIVVGVSGVGAATQALPWLVETIRWVGAAFLVCYGLLAARRALRPVGEAILLDGTPAAPVGGGPGTSQGTVPATLRPAAASTSTLAAPAPTTTRQVALTCLALTWLNPHVYLDTVFLLGSVGSAQGEDRWLFAFGAMAASTIWFFSLAYGARLLGRWLATVTAWRILDAVIAVVMVVLGISLVA